MTLSHETKQLITVIGAVVLMGAVLVTALICMEPVHTYWLFFAIPCACMMPVAGVTALLHADQLRRKLESRAASEAAKPNPEVEQLRSLVDRLQSAIDALTEVRDVPNGHLAVSLYRNDKLNGVEIHGIPTEKVDPILTDLEPHGWRYSKTNSCMYLKLAKNGNGTRQETTAQSAR